MSPSTNNNNKIFFFLNKFFLFSSLLLLSVVAVLLLAVAVVWKSIVFKHRRFCNMNAKEEIPETVVDRHEHAITNSTFINAEIMRTERPIGCSPK